MAFPIVGFRCGPMEEYWVDSMAADSAVVRWRKVEQGTLFNVRLVGSDGSDTTYITADTSMALGGLVDTVRYNVMLRKQCRYTTTNYDTTVYGAWLSTLSFGHGPEVVGDTNVGIAAVPSEVFALVPNPARGSVSVVMSAAPGGHLSVLDMAGREWVSLPVEGPVAELDVSALPAGVFLVRLTTDADVSTRRLLLLD
ncbi:MAG: T9SS type A sorting domain-containing protein [Bacteroidales bacterium]|nr:T9SS type A sorting domain-containing protein [Bacteroidales bacterium]